MWLVSVQLKSFLVMNYAHIPMCGGFAEIFSSPLFIIICDLEIQSCLEKLTPFPSCQFNHFTCIENNLKRIMLPVLATLTTTAVGTNHCMVFEAQELFGNAAQTVFQRKNVYFYDFKSF